MTEPAAATRAADGDAPNRAAVGRATVCQVLHSLNVGGAEVLAERLAQDLADQFNFVFACLDDLGPLEAQLRRSGFQVELLGRRSGVDLGCARRLASFARREHVDLIHAHQYTPFSYSLLSGIRPWPAGSLQRRPPILFTEHGRWFPDYPRRKRIVLNRLLLRQRDRVVGVGNSVRQALIDNEGIAPSRVQVIYNGIGIGPSTARLDPEQRAAIRREMHSGPDDFVIVQVARLDALKDHATALRTIQRVSQAVPHARLVLVGEGPERASIERTIDRANLHRCVELLGLRSDVRRLLSAADAFLLTSVSEGIPLTLIEAMAAGLPVVSTSVGGIPEIVEHEKSGLLAPAGDDALLADALVLLSGDASVRQRIGLAGQRRAAERFDEQANHQAYRRLYEEMLRG